jgi:hypothetical protein
MLRIAPRWGLRRGTPVHESESMIRIIAVAACGLTLAACTSWMPSFDIPSFRSGPAMTTLSIESDPPGADAKLSTGGECRTPCTLSVPVSEDFTVSFALAGHQPETVPVRAVPGSGGFSGEVARLEPNPLYVELQALPPPAVKKRPTTKKPRTAAKPAPRPAAAAAPSAAAPPPAPPPAQPLPAAPWPAPR